MSVATSSISLHGFLLSNLQLHIYIYIYKFLVSQEWVDYLTAQILVS